MLQIAFMSYCFVATCILATGLILMMVSPESLYELGADNVPTTVVMVALTWPALLTMVLVAWGVIVILDHVHPYGDLDE